MSDFGQWLKEQFNGVFAWFRHDESRFDEIGTGIARIERDQQFFFKQLFAKVDQMANDLDAVTTEITADTNAMTLAASAIDALLAANSALVSGDATAHAQAAAAAQTAATARTALQGEIDKANAAVASGTTTVTATGTTSAT